LEYLNRPYERERKSRVSLIQCEKGTEQTSSDAACNEELTVPRGSRRTRAGRDDQRGYRPMRDYAASSGRAFPLL
jgi:hypothetical protein